jgi:hydroxypyruvate isomerase
MDVDDLSVNLELLFREAGERTSDRVRAAADSGFRRVEFWNWRAKDLRAVQRAMAATGTALQVMCVEPMGHLVDRTTHDAFLAGLRESVPVAEDLGCPFLFLIARDRLPGVERAVQHESVVEALTRAAEVLDGHEVVLLLENLNSRTDMPDTYLDSSPETIEILRAVGSPSVGMLYDVYHSVVMDETPAEVLREGAELIRHIQIADVPGKGEPGSGSVDWVRFLAELRDANFPGAVGLEYVPTTDSARSVHEIRQIVSRS